jgi:4-hydroxybenzoate polyprenyltransferase
MNRTITSTSLPSPIRLGPAPGLRERLGLYLKLSRPFTLLPPTLGVVSGAVTAFGSAANPDPARRVSVAVVLTVILGSLCAALLNAANNILNQVYDLDIDRVNKPKRPIPAGQVSIREALLLSAVLYAAAVVPTWLVVVYPYEGLGAKLFAPIGRHECLVIYLLGMAFTFIYSVPALGRTKARGIWANITIAIPRGCLLKVAGWSMVASVWHVEPWYIGSIILLFLLGAASTKDFSDIEGDRAGGCRTLPILYGPRRAAQISAPFFVVPWLLIPLGAHLPNPWFPGHTILTGNPDILTALGGLLAVWGAYTSWLMLRDPDELARTENHPSWTHMYLMMIFAQVGFAVGYMF